ncbi:MAG: PQQ-dependent sugar dehydrogenase [Bacteroidota bacterium]
MSGLDVPWSIAFQGQHLYFTERGGKLWVLHKGERRPLLVSEIHETYHNGEGGLMGLAFHPKFFDNDFLYLSYTYQTSDGSASNKVVRFRLVGKQLQPEKTIVENLPGAGIHNGCRIRFGPDGKLYITTGDAARREIAQDMSSLGGKILRLNDDGTVPKDNPIQNSPIYSLGHRNGQGLDWHPVFNLLFETEHGPSGFDGPGGGDEINRVEPGRNYGWPTIHHKQSADGLVSPLVEFTPALAPSGASFCTGKRFPKFKGDFFVATLRGKRLLRVRVDKETGKRILGVEALLTDMFGRLRDIVEGPDGLLYFCTNNRDGRGTPGSDDDRILRLVPID